MNSTIKNFAQIKNIVILVTIVAALFPHLVVLEVFKYTTIISYGIITLAYPVSLIYSIYLMTKDSKDFGIKIISDMKKNIMHIFVHAVGAMLAVIVAKNNGLTVSMIFSLQAMLAFCGVIIALNTIEIREKTTE